MVQPESQDDELTNLNWLQDKNLLSNVSLSVGNQDHSQRLERSCHSRFLSELNSNLTFRTLTSFPEGKVIESNNNDNLVFSSNLPSQQMVCHESESTAVKPPFSFPSLIFMAIESSSKKSLPVNEIYNWIMHHYPYYETASSGWKNTVRHNLSLNKCFQKVSGHPAFPVQQQNTSSIMKGSLWAVDPAFRPSLIESIRRASLLSNPHFDIPVDVTEKSLTKMRSTTTVVTPSVDSKETDAIESMLRLTKHCIPCLSPTPEEEVKFVRQQECLKRKSNPDIVLHLKGDPGKEHNYSNNKKVVGTQADVLKVVNNPIVFNPILTTCDHSSQGFLAQVDYESMKGAEVLFSLLTKNRSRLSSNDQQFSSSKKFKSEPKH